MQNILISKLIPPDPSIYYLRRSKLLKKLSKSERVKLTIVHSGAGFGKTSALAQLMADQKKCFSWYQVTEEDDDILPFFRHLFYSIQRVIPEFGRSMDGWDNFSRFPKLVELNKLALSFINELFHIQQKLYIVLDDFHVVQHVFQINYILNKIIENLPANVHMIAASRLYPNWNCLPSLKMKGELVECKEEDFLFSTEEVQVLFEDYFHRSLTDDETAAIISITEGWAIAVCLLALQSNESPLEIGEIANLSLQDFFSYLSEEVFENLSDFEKECLLKCSIFQTFTLDIIRQFYDEEATAQIKSIIKKQSFIQPLVGYQEFRFHALYHQFLEMKLMEGNHAQYVKLHKDAAGYFTEQDNAVRALYHCIKSKDDALVTAALVHFSNYFLEAGQYDYFLERLRELPVDNKNKSYILYFYEGECQRFRAQYEKAKKAYEKCLNLAEETNDLPAVLKANTGLAHIYLDTIQPGLAENYLKEALKLSEVVELEQKEYFQLERQYAENLVNLGRAGEAEARVLAKKLPEHVLIQGNLDVRILLRQGKLAKANRLIRQREGRDMATSSDAHRETDVLHALILACLGDVEEAFENAIKSIRNSVKDHAQYSEAVATLRKGHAIMLLSPYALKEAEECYLKTNELMDHIHVTRAKAESFMGLAIVKSRQGYLQEAVSFANQGLYETERVQDQWVSALLLTALAIIFVENGYFDEAKERAIKANELFKRSPDHYGEMATSFWLSYIACKQQNEFELNHYFQQFLNLCYQNHYFFFLRKKSLFGPASFHVFLEIINEWLRHNGIGEKNMMMSLLQLEKGSVIPNSSFTLQLLGPFSMVRNQIEIISDKEWKREKAKELFLYLYLNQHRYASKEEIMNAIWPNSDEQSMNRDFKVAYNACLKAIEPTRSARDESAYIMRKQSMYKLHQNKVFASDVDEFRKFAARGMEEKEASIALEWLVKAASLYRGDLLEDLSSAEWLARPREELRNAYNAVLERIAQNYIRLKDFQSTIHWAEKLVLTEPTWEEGYRLLMLANYYLNNRPQAVKWYEKCAALLEEELNIAPMESTVEIFEMIMR